MNKAVVWISGIFLLLTTAGVSYAIFFTNAFEQFGVGMFILLSSLLAISFAFIGWIVTYKLTVATNTVNAIHQSRISENLDKHRSVFSHTQENQPISNDVFESLESKDLKTSTLHVLNYLEFVSLAMKEGHYSERLCRLYYRGIFRSNYLRTRLIIENLQMQNSKVFNNFLYYVHRWNPDIPR